MIYSQVGYDLICPLNFPMLRHRPWHAVVTVARLLAIFRGDTPCEESYD
jgi:hypothetical protein